MARDTEKFRAWLRDVRDNPLPRYYLAKCWAYQTTEDDSSGVPSEDGSSRVPSWYIELAEYQDGPDGYWEPERFRKFWNIPEWATGHNLPYLVMDATQKISENGSWRSGGRLPRTR